MAYAYTVSPGDTCNSVATTIGTTPYMISEYNNIPLYGEILSNLPPGITTIMIPTADEFMSVIDNRTSQIMNTFNGALSNYSSILTQRNYESYQEYIKNKVVRPREIAITNRDLYGGRQTQHGIDVPAKDPGYHPLTILVKESGRTIETIILKCIAFNEQRSNRRSLTDTNAGTFINKSGKNPVQLSFTGVFFDIKGQQEKHQFIEKYKTYIEDRQREDFQYFNDYTISIQHQGVLYIGTMQNISFSKQAASNLLYQYNFSFISLRDTTVYDESYVTSGNVIGSEVVAVAPMPITESYQAMLKDPLNTSALKTLNYARSLSMPYAV